MEYKLRIKEAREKCGMTQEEVAKKSNLNQSYVSQLERGDTNAKSPTLRTIFRIAKALKICPHALVEYNTKCSEDCSHICKQFF